MHKANSSKIFEGNDFAGEKKINSKLEKMDWLRLYYIYR